MREVLLAKNKTPVAVKVRGHPKAVLDVEAGGPITGSGRVPDRKVATKEGDYQQAATTHKPPSDIPDGSDDDVVARQLRSGDERI